ncbi:MAG: DUF4838 domain-containing protein, partial [Planctomycetes bacterium]|nr:DUF4838 domain-containing protein [Planctomycetota bacterium]
MATIRVFVVLAACLAVAALACESAVGETTLVAAGASDYVIVVSKDAGPSEQWAAKDLAEHLKLMSGAALKVQDEAAGVPDKAIVIGDGEAARSLGVKADMDALGEDGFLLKTVGDRIVIVGGRKRGTMYGVYEVLRKLGCRWWAPGESTIPTMTTVAVPELDEQKRPILEYRDMLYGDLWEGSNRADSSEAAKALWREGRLWCARNWVHAAFHEMPDDLGPIDMDTAIAHRMINYLPADRYMAEHPEWYALRGDKRMTDHICLANMDAAKETAANVVKALDKTPNWRLITLGQADNGNFCTCDKCKALVEKHGANSGMILNFINEVARLVKEKYPKVTINTNAYRWSQAAPKGIRCEDNVMITIPPIACNYAAPISDGWPQENADYTRDLSDWGKICNKIYVWDYTTNFVHYVMPWPNMYVLQPNIRFFIDNNVRGIFAQGSHTTNNAQFSTLVMWVQAQAMWNPDADNRELVKEFCLGYYGPKAGPLVLDYINMLNDKIVNEKIAIWATHRTHLSAEYLTPEIIARGETLFRQAEQAVKDDPALLRRVEIAHFPVQYMLLRRPYAFWDAAAKANPGMTWPQVTAQFARVGREAGIARLSEGDGATPFYEWAEDYGKKMAADPKACLPAELKETDPSKYTLIQAAQFDGQVRFLKKVDGATDGWVQTVLTHGWSITNHLLPPKDFTSGRTYMVYARVKGEIAEGATGQALQIGIHHPQRKRVSSGLDAAEMDGQWHTISFGP